MKHTFVALAFLVGPFLQAAQPADLGHFKGLVFSSATERHPLEINGGTLVKCEVNATYSAMTTCEVEKGSIVVTGDIYNSLNIRLESVAILPSKYKPATHHYYYRGTADLMIGDQAVAARVQVTLSIEDALPNRVRGFIELPDQYAKSSIEAYLVP